MTDTNDILDALDHAAENRDRVTVGHVNDEIGHRGTGALLAIPASLELTPIGGIPGVPTLIGLIVAIFAVQIVMGREDMWLPGFLENRNVKSERLRKAVEKLRPAADWADRHLGRHLTVLTDPPAPRIAAAAILLLCLTIPPLEVVPFASSIPTSTIVLFGLGLLLRDGRVMALAWAAWIAALIGVWMVWPSDWSFLLFAG
ncbi:exopolysaccharide biosynthesis protein [Jannaschia sp. S6380]|uniref:exopolysaccharide biosynthesis protein n=1 Tax=Jannaschia sp. S6380 TaxID=2926408 RepID=UPI001FF5C5EF|nr:exopolysaccharide biosynthesis protein [Jannaschia sp. S6380]MCK0166512.1 exopolysaccharide biosynthesis protein [Jannaschia sp. S6380]